MTREKVDAVMLVSSFNRFLASRCAVTREGGGVSEKDGQEKSRPEISFAEKR